MGSNTGGIWSGTLVDPEVHRQGAEILWQYLDGERNELVDGWANVGKSFRPGTMLDDSSGATDSQITERSFTTPLREPDLCFTRVRIGDPMLWAATSTAVKCVERVSTGFHRRYIMTDAI